MKDDFVCEESQALTEMRSTIIKLTVAFMASLCAIAALAVSAAAIGYLGEEDLPNILFLCAVLILVVGCVILGTMIYRRTKTCKELAKIVLCRYIAYSMRSANFIKGKNVQLKCATDLSSSPKSLFKNLRKNILIVVKDIADETTVQLNYDSVLALRFYSIGTMDFFTLICDYFAAQCSTIVGRRKLPGEVAICFTFMNNSVTNIVSNGQLVRPVKDNNPFIKYNLV